MSNDYFQYQATKYQQAELARAAEQHRLAKQAAESDRAARKGGATGSHHRGVRLFGRSPRASAC
ncbi:hypothetical protein ACEZDB_04875 [Streptacidiphilus sp. N1-3]|uniref:Uncharacterized protein n=1 Tax=Streptacidiphilus alkalitolerans TaxID=3342712 RepID=A0ABV6WVJ3_9ACTN